MNNSTAAQENRLIAATILKQLGGRRFMMMTGTKPKYFDGKTSTFQLTRNKAKAKWMKITLNSMDLYDIEFVGEKKVLDKDMTALFGKRCYDSELVTVKELKNIYNDQLEEVFTSVTGLYTRM